MHLVSMFSFSVFWGVPYSTLMIFDTATTRIPLMIVVHDEVEDVKEAVIVSHSSGTTS
jgi:hypothetical protein